MNNGILQQFDKQRNRGTEGFGLFDGSKMHMVHEKKENKILKWLVRYDSNLILFHHRFPTSTVNVKRAAHPFSTKKFFDKEYILVHNGIIRNAEETKKKHEKLGITYHSQLHDGSFNDSEALLWDMALYLEGQQEYLTVYGSIAFICLEKTADGLEKMHFGRNNGNPLNLFQDKKGIALSSEGPGDNIFVNKLYTFDYDSQEIDSLDLNIPQWGDYTYGYSPKEWDDLCGYSPREWRPTPTVPNQQTLGEQLSSNLVYSGFKTVQKQLKNNILVRNTQEKNPELLKGFIDYDAEGNPTYTGQRGGFNPDAYFGADGKPIANLQPEAGDIFDEVIRYLDMSLGKFDEAINNVELDYNDLAKDTLTQSVLRDMILLEKVQEFITTQPDYLKGSEVSQLWLMSMQSY